MELGKGKLYCNSCRDVIVEIPLTPEGVESMKQYVNYTCPNCHKAVIMTQKEYDYVKLVFKIANSHVLKLIERVLCSFGRKKRLVRIDTEPLRFGEKPDIIELTTADK